MKRKRLVGTTGGKVRRRSKQTADPPRELFIVQGRSKYGKIRRVYPTRQLAEEDAERARKKRGAEVEVVSSLD